MKLKVISVYKSFEIIEWGTGCTVEYCGDEVFFNTVEEAMEFIDTL